MLNGFVSSYTGVVGVAAPGAVSPGPRYLCTKTSTPPTWNISQTVLSMNW